MSGADRGRSWVTADQLLDEARNRLGRLAPERARAAARAGALLIDIRSELQRERDGVIPGSRFIARNVLEWRCDRASPWHDPAVTNARARVILICNEGYQSSLAAATLQQLGLVDATDVIGGFQAWKAAGLPVRPLGRAGAGRGSRRERAAQLQPRGEEEMRAIDCPCGHHFEAADDEELFRVCREHVDSDHPEMERTDEQLRARIAADAYDPAQVSS